MLRLARVIAVVIVCLTLTGGHWLVLQSVAWTKMLADYSRTQPVAQAISDTFDGQHPCEMCVSIQEGKKQEKKSEATVSAQIKIEGVVSGGKILVLPPLRDGYSILPPVLWTSVSSTPPTPPPKA